jgi:hypothetical protein
MKPLDIHAVHTEGVELTLQSLLAYWGNHQHFAIAWSGGKDSTALLTLVIHLIDACQSPGRDGSDIPDQLRIVPRWKDHNPSIYSRQPGRGKHAAHLHPRNRADQARDCRAFGIDGERR